MSTLNIQFSPASQVRWFNVPVSVEVMNSDLQVIGRMTMKDQGQVQVDPGFYLVRARLPSGESALSTATILEEQSSADVTLQTSQSPHEWLAWQNFLGEVPRVGAQVSLAQSPAISLLVWEYGTGGWSTLPASGWRGYPQHDQQTAIEELNLASRPFTLRMVQIGAPTLPSRLISLPATRHTIQVLMRPSRVPTDLNGGLAVKVASMDQDAEALSHYLNSGTLEAASTVADRIAAQSQEFASAGDAPEAEVAEQLLGNKLPNPFGAVVGGYYLLRTRNYERLHNWPNNFANWVPWLPDSAIIHAWQLLRTEGPEGRDLARKRLVQAAERGLPVMTEGMRLLVDGLQLFADHAQANRQPDETIEAALEGIRHYATAMDWNQRLTTFYGSRPDLPSLTPVTLSGEPSADRIIIDLT